MKKKLLIIIGAIVVIIIIAVVVSGSKEEPAQSTSPLVSVETGQSAAAPSAATAQEAASNDLVTLLRSVTTLTLNPAVFSNPVYQALGRETLVLPDPAVRGRINPFASLGAAATPAATNPGSTIQVGGPSAGAAVQQ